MTYRPEVDGLRAIAVLAVLAYHLMPDLLPGGFAGVDVFFVISGYVITASVARDLEAGRFSIAAFYERRVRRIAPALCAVLLLTCLGGAFVLLPSDLVALGKSALSALLMTSNVRFWDEAGYFDAAAQAKPLLHTWSLGIEEQFYLVYPVLFAWGWRRARRLLVPAVAALAAASFAAGVWMTAESPSTAFYLAPFRAWELLVGALLALAPLRRLEGSPVTAVGVAMIAASYALFDDATLFPGVAAALPTTGAALAIAGASRGAWATRLLGAGPLVFVGKISFSLYLAHWPLIVFVEYQQGAPLDGRQAVAIAVASVALAALSFAAIEQPFRTRRLIATRRRAFAATAVGGLGVGLAAAILILSGGLPERLPPEVLASYTARADRWPDRPRCFIDTDGEFRLTPAKIRAGEICAFGGAAGESSPDFVIWGDSHAAAMAPAILESAKRHGARGAFIGAGSCPPLTAFELIGARRSVKRTCRDTNAAVLDFLRGHPATTVFMVARWPKYALGNEYGDEGLFFDPRQIAPPVPGQAQKFAASLDATLGELRDMRVRPILVMDVPEPGYDVPYAASRALLEDRPANDVAPSPSAVANRQRQARAIMTAAARLHDAELVDPTSAFCTASACRVEKDGVLLYSDADHLSLSGAHAISYIFDEEFRELMMARDDNQPKRIR
jgi:peptidoglycan/LPS O-acetylase OafA/YrhL